MPYRIIIKIMLGLLLAGAPLLVQAAEKTAMHGHATASVCKKSASVKAYIAAMETMHRDMNIRYTGNTDIDFARGMIPHHQGAVEMARVLLAHSKDEALRTLAERIITWQNVEIGIMKHWLRVRGAVATETDARSRDSVKAYIAAMETMHRDMNIRYTGNVDLDFVNGMIPHHQGAVEMAKVLLDSGVSPELRKIAQDIIRSQRQEISLMQAWRTGHLGE